MELKESSLNFFMASLGLIVILSTTFRLLFNNGGMEMSIYLFLGILLTCKYGVKIINNNIIYEKEM